MRNIMVSSSLSIRNLMGHLFFQRLTSDCSIVCFFDLPSFTRVVTSPFRPIFTRRVRLDPNLTFLRIDPPNPVLLKLSIPSGGSPSLGEYGFHALPRCPSDLFLLLGVLLSLVNTGFTNPRGT
ncbi:hypothetical protein TNCV_379841 [Trichonephila clavipes]|nr:hypothetical protein TNCV_379841 [Trichonephila clavipes]